MWSEFPEKSLQAALGDLLARHRKNRGLTQTQLAEKAGIGTATLVRLENTGQSNVDNFLRVLRALRLLDRLEEAISLPEKSPLELLRKQEHQ
jgi:transcriptional regulator with XRE-family HTH domain